MFDTAIKTEVAISGEIMHAQGHSTHCDLCVSTDAQRPQAGMSVTYTKNDHGTLASITAGHKGQKVSVKGHLGFSPTGQMTIIANQISLIAVFGDALETPRIEAHTNQSAIQQPVVQITTQATKPDTNQSVQPVTQVAANPSQAVASHANVAHQTAVPVVQQVFAQNHESLELNRGNEMLNDLDSESRSELHTEPSVAQEATSSGHKNEQAFTEADFTDLHPVAVDPIVIPQVSAQQVNPQPQTQAAAQQTIATGATQAGNQPDNHANPPTTAQPAQVTRRPGRPPNSERKIQATGFSPNF